MEAEQIKFLENECNYLRDELKEQVKELNLLARNTIMFSAGIISLIYITGKAGIPENEKHGFAWLPLIINFLMAYRTHTLGRQIQRISNYIQKIKEKIFPGNNTMGWERTMNKWRGINNKSGKPSVIGQTFRLLIF